MEKRRYGRTGHMSSVAVLGCAGLGSISQPDADAAIEKALAAGVNHFDVAPSYGHAEDRLGPWMPRIRKQIFLACKTEERGREGAAVGMRASLKRLQTESFDLYQLHAITKMEELDAVTAQGGALEAFVEARKEGLTRFLGITGHGFDSPAIFIEALKRFNFDTVMFPVNFIQFGNPTYRRNAIELLRICKAQDVGVEIIKSIARGPWGDMTQAYDTWYQPLDDIDMIQKGVDFVLSQEVTGLCTAGDTRILPFVLRACENYTPLSAEIQEGLISLAPGYTPLFVPV
jgi:aryl-alcohol dehydrogenase-like predicted oxidoreductase